MRLLESLRWKFLGVKNRQRLGCDLSWQKCACYGSKHMLQQRAAGAGAHIVKHGHYEPHEARVQLLVRRLRGHVHVAGQHRDVRVAVHPAHHARALAAGCHESLRQGRCGRQLLRAGLHAVLMQVWRGSEWL